MYKTTKSIDNFSSEKKDGNMIRTDTLFFNPSSIYNETESYPMN
jgi:hypothetical protein